MSLALSTVGLANDVTSLAILANSASSITTPTSFLISFNISSTALNVPFCVYSTASAEFLYLLRVLIICFCTLSGDSPVFLPTIAPIPAKPTENKAPAVAPIVVSAAVLLPENSPFSPN